MNRHDYLRRAAGLPLIRIRPIRTPQEHIGVRIRKAREALGVTATKLAEAIGASTPATVTNIERGRNYPCMENLLRIANALDVEPATLLPSLQEIR